MIAFTPETLATYWGVSSATVRGLIRKGELRAFHVGRQMRIRPEWVVEYETRYTNHTEDPAVVAARPLPQPPPRQSGPTFIPTPSVRSGPTPEQRRAAVLAAWKASAALKPKRSGG